MEVNHEKSLKILDSFFNKLSYMSKERALDAACGDGRLTSDFLSRFFEEVDMFDQCPKAINIVNNLKKEVKQIKNVQLKKMQNYVFTQLYTCIILRWATGWVEDDEIKEFLRKCSLHLKNWKRNSNGTVEKGSFIIVLDNPEKRNLT